MTIETLWNNSNRDERAAMLCGVGVEASSRLQAWSDVDEFARLPEVVRFSLSAEFASGELRASRDTAAIGAANDRMKGGQS